MPKQIYVNGKPFFNAAGDFDPTTAGFQYARTTLSFIRSKVLKQKFYEIDISEYLPVDMGEAAWADEIVQNATFFTGGDFFKGDVELGGGKHPQVDTGITPIRMPVRNWAYEMHWTISEVALAAQANKWDVVESKLAALKKTWDLGIQKLAFLGRPGDTVMTGLMNNAVVTLNTSVVPVAISAMSTAQFSTFVGAVLAAYANNSNSTAFPDTFVMPMSDYLGLGVPVSQTYPNVTQLAYLLDTFKKMTGNEKFVIKPLAYAEAAKSGGAFAKNRSALYRNDPDTLSLSIPVQFTMPEPRTVDSYTWTQLAYGQYSGVLINRPREVLLFEQQA